MHRWECETWFPKPACFPSAVTLLAKGENLSVAQNNRGVWEKGLVLPSTSRSEAKDPHLYQHWSFVDTPVTSQVKLLMFYCYYLSILTKRFKEKARLVYQSYVFVEILVKASSEFTMEVELREIHGLRITVRFRHDIDVIFQLRCCGKPRFPVSILA